MKYALLCLTMLIVHSLAAQEMAGVIARWTMNGDCEMTDQVTQSPADGVLVDVSPAADRDGRKNAALSFSSNTSYITCGVAEKLKLAGDKSITFWINPAVTGTSRTGSIFSYGTGINIRYEEQASVPRLHIIFGNTSYMRIDLEPNKWQSVTITFTKDFSSTASQAQCYINGIKIAEAEQNKSAHDFNNAIVLIGPTDQSALSNGFRGMLDDMRVYNRAVTAVDARDIAGRFTLDSYPGQTVNGLSGRLKVFPNRGKEYIRITGVSRRVNITVVNSLGRTVIRRQIFPDYALDISALLPGVYYVMISDGSKQVSSKFIKR